MVEESSGLSRGTAIQPYAVPSDTAPLRFDFGTATSPVQTNFLQVIPQTIYSATRGYGWATRVAAGDRRDNYTTVGYNAVTHDTATPLRTDFNSGRNATFKVDLPDRHVQHPDLPFEPAVLRQRAVHDAAVLGDGRRRTPYVVPAIRSRHDVHPDVERRVGVGWILEIVFGWDGTVASNFMVAGIDISAGSLPGVSPLLAAGESVGRRRGGDQLGHAAAGGGGSRGAVVGDEADAGASGDAGQRPVHRGRSGRRVSWAWPTRPPTRCGSTTTRR